MNTTKVKFYRQDFEKINNPFTPEWYLPREFVCAFETGLKGEAAAEQCFKIFNAPHSILTPEEQRIASYNRGPSMSVGDIAEVDGVDYLCDSFGWKTRAA